MKIGKTKLKMSNGTVRKFKAKKPEIILREWLGLINMVGVRPTKNEKRRTIKEN